MNGKRIGAVGLGCLAFILLGMASDAKSQKVPSNLEILQSLQKTWAGVACTGKLEVALGEGTAPMISAPVAVAFQNNTLKWAVFVTPPTPCAGSVVLGGVKVGLGNKPDLLMGVPPGMIIGNKPATLAWTKLERKEGATAAQNLNNVCSGLGGGDATDYFSAFAGGMSHRPDQRSWDKDQPHWLKLEGESRDNANAVTGRYTVWLDRVKGYLPVKSIRVPLKGATVTTLFEPAEVAKDKWLPVRWTVSGAARATIVGDFRSLACGKTIPASWFEKATYPDVQSQKVVLDAIQAK